VPIWVTNIEERGGVMAKTRDARKDEKKKPLKSIQDKKKDKKLKKGK
jgi:hypothetical protein